jgi:hypothetical protein
MVEGTDGKVSGSFCANAQNYKPAVTKTSIGGTLDS